MLKLIVDNCFVRFLPTAISDLIDHFHRDWNSAPPGQEFNNTLPDSILTTSLDHSSRSREQFFSLRVYWLIQTLTSSWKSNDNVPCFLGIWILEDHKFTIVIDCDSLKNLMTAEREWMSYFFINPYKIYKSWQKK